MLKDFHETQSGSGKIVSPFDRLRMRAWRQRLSFETQACGLFLRMRIENVAAITTLARCTLSPMLNTRKHTVAHERRNKSDEVEYRSFAANKNHRPARQCEAAAKSSSEQVASIFWEGTGQDGQIHLVFPYHGLRAQPNTQTRHNCHCYAGHACSDPT